MHLQVSNPDPHKVTRLSEDTIPSVKGEWYNYRSVFTPMRPLGYLMKCKANKDRPLCFVEENDGVDITFVFDEEVVQVCSPDSEHSLKMMAGRVDPKTLKKVNFVQTSLTKVQFDAIRIGKDVVSLLTVCQSGSVANCLLVTKGIILAIKTQAGIYCLMRATEVNPHKVCFDACHILL